MNIIKGSVLKSKLPNIMAIYTKRGVSAWNRDWMPGPYPETPEEKAAAAKKYGLLPEEYDCDPEGYGDYPKLPDISGDSKDPHYNWDHPHLKRDWNEPMHENFNIISEDRLDVNYFEKQQIHPIKQILMFFGTMAAFGIPIWLCEHFKIFTSLPHAKQHFPSDGPHYKYPSSQ